MFCDCRTWEIYEGDGGGGDTEGGVVLYAQELGGLEIGRRDGGGTEAFVGYFSGRQAECSIRFIPTLVGNSDGLAGHGLTDCGSSPRLWGTPFLSRDILIIFWNSYLIFFIKLDMAFGHLSFPFS